MYFFLRTLILVQLGCGHIDIYLPEWFVGCIITKQKYKTKIIKTIPFLVYQKYFVNLSVSSLGLSFVEKKSLI